jgi:hypothetical protein
MSAFHPNLPLACCKPSLAANQDELSPGVGLSQIIFDWLSILNRQTSDDFRHAAALT